MPFFKPKKKSNQKKKNNNTTNRIRGKKESDQKGGIEETKGKGKELFWTFWLFLG